MRSHYFGAFRPAATVAILAALSPATLFAGLIFSGSGNNGETGHAVSGEATFSVSGNTLNVVLTNTTSGATLAQGDVLTGVVFDVSGQNPSLSLTSISLTPGSSIYTSTSTTNNAAALTGSWTDDLASTATHEFGVATTGFGGQFNGGAITLGNSSANYGLIADGTSLASGFPRFPYIMNSLTFSFSGAAGLSESAITNVGLLFGTDGTGYIDPPPSVTTPEPGALGLAVIGAVGVAGFTFRRWRRPARA